jgi:DNA-binding IclR family transcriptional regulator
VEWTFLTNYAHVLICLSQDPAQRLRDVAQRVGITERAVQRIVHDLHDAGYLEVSKDGRRNRYQIAQEMKLRHPVEQGATIRDLIALAERASRG